jgi:hypothetical protein
MDYLKAAGTGSLGFARYIALLCLAGWTRGREKGTSAVSLSFVSLTRSCIHAVLVMVDVRKVCTCKEHREQASEGQRNS